MKTTNLFLKSYGPNGQFASRKRILPLYSSRDNSIMTTSERNEQKKEKAEFNGLDMLLKW